MADDSELDLARAELDRRAWLLYGRAFAEVEPAEMARTALFLAWATLDHFAKHRDWMREAEHAEFLQVESEAG